MLGPCSEDEADEVLSKVAEFVYAPNFGHDVTVVMRPEDE